MGLVIREYSEFGRNLVESLSYGRGGTANWLSKLSEDQIGEFYVWMMSNYPPSQSDHRGARAMSPRQGAVMVRDTDGPHSLRDEAMVKAVGNDQRMQRKVETHTRQIEDSRVHRHALRMSRRARSSERSHGRERCGAVASPRMLSGTW
jgi:hypothetical protein